MTEPRPRGQRRRWPVAAALIALILVVGGGALVLSGASAQEPMNASVNTQTPDSMHWHHFIGNNWVTDQTGVDGGEFYIDIDSQAGLDDGDEIEVWPTIEGQSLPGYNITYDSSQTTYRINHTYRPVDYADALGFSKTDNISVGVTLVHPDFQNTPVTKDVQLLPHQLSDESEVDIYLPPAQDQDHDPDELPNAYDEVDGDAGFTPISIQFREPPGLGEDQYIPLDGEFTVTLVINGQVIEETILQDGSVVEPDSPHEFNFEYAESDGVGGAQAYDLRWSNGFWDGTEAAIPQFGYDNQVLIDDYGFQDGEELTIEVYLQDVTDGEEVQTFTHDVSLMGEELAIGDPGNPQPADPLFPGILVVLLLSAITFVLGVSGGHWIYGVGGVWTMLLPLAVLTDETPLLVIVVLFGLLMAAGFGRFAAGVFTSAEQG